MPKSYLYAYCCQTDAPWPPSPAIPFRFKLPTPDSDCSVYLPPVTSTSLRTVFAALKHRNSGFSSLAHSSPCAYPGCR